MTRRSSCTSRCFAHVSLCPTSSRPTTSASCSSCRRARDRRRERWVQGGAGGGPGAGGRAGCSVHLACVGAPACDSPCCRLRLRRSWTAGLMRHPRPATLRQPPGSWSCCRRGWAAGWCRSGAPYRCLFLSCALLLLGGPLPQASAPGHAALQATFGQFRDVCQEHYREEEVVSAGGLPAAQAVLAAGSEQNARGPAAACLSSLGKLCRPCAPPARCRRRRCP